MISQEALVTGVAVLELLGESRSAVRTGSVKYADVEQERDQISEHRALPFVNQDGPGEHERRP